MSLLMNLLKQSDEESGLVLLVLLQVRIPVNVVRRPVLNVKNEGHLDLSQKKSTVLV